MASKLSQVNAVIENVTRLLDDFQPDTGMGMGMSSPGAVRERPLLLVFGDHGMTVGGDHGGDSPSETDSALFAFAPSERHSDSDSDADVDTDADSSDRRHRRVSAGVDFRRARQLLEV